MFQDLAKSERRKERNKRCISPLLCFTSFTICVEKDLITNKQESGFVVQEQDKEVLCCSYNHYVPREFPDTSRGRTWCLAVVVADTGFSRYSDPGFHGDVTSPDAGH